MRPYAAVIKDSFREALASRVLWILLLLITLLLLAIAPLGLSERAGAYFDVVDLINVRSFITRLDREQASTQPSPSRRLWALLSDDIKQSISDELQGEKPARRSGLLLFELREELNQALASKDLYDPAAWAGIQLSQEAQDLLARGVEPLSPEELARSNRLLLEAAYPDEIAPSRDRQTVATYLGYDFSGPLSMDQGALIDIVLTGFTGVVLGILGVFAGILVTASIIPQMFEAGAIDLLLSKPVSRPLLYLTKFVGGCAFILINAAYVIGGLWLILGLRFGLWRGELLLCVPLFMFLFSIYYSVSALFGALWKNAIVSVVMTILFWAACFGVGTTKNTVEMLALNPMRLIKLVPAGEAVVAVNERGETLRWDAKENAWRQALVAEGPSDRVPPFVSAAPPIGPVYDRRQQRLIALPPRFPQFGVQNNALAVGKAADDWKRIPGASAPDGTAALFLSPQGVLVAVSPQGVFRLQGDPAQQERRISVFGFELPLSDGGAKFVPAGPALRLRAPISASMDPQNGELAVLGGGKLMLFQPAQDGQFRLRLERDLDSDKPSASKSSLEPGLVALAADTLVLALSDGRVRILDPADLSPQHEYRPEGANAPRFIEASPNGRYFALLFHHRKLWLYDAGRRRELEIEELPQGDISAVGFAASDRLLVADRFVRVTEHRLDPFEVLRRLSPAPSVVERVYRYGIRPLYTVFPKPGELDNVVAYVLTKKETVAADPGAQDLQTARVPIDVWGPVWSSLAFVAVMVALGCMYTQRKDF